MGKPVIDREDDLRIIREWNVARAEGFRAGAEAMKNATLEDIAYRIEYGAKKYGRRDISVEIMRAIEEMVRSLPIPESDHG